jgi:8-oxo-dGTP pyrophosphatase MutT (NUDIX family)
MMPAVLIGGIMKNYILSAGVIIVRGLPEPHYLLLRAFEYWDFPKSVVEPGEDPFLGAQREVREETGLTELNFRWGGTYQETRPYGAGKIARYYLAEAREGKVFLPVNPILGRPEHDEFRWVDFEAARALLGPRLKPILNWADWLVTHDNDESA